MIAVVDSGGANLASIVGALEALGAVVELAADPARVRAADKVVLPGVGAAAHAMERLRRFGLDRCLPELRQPVLGVCLGMQLLFARSEEGPADCLGIIPGQVTRLRPPGGLPVPHMGWNETSADSDPLLAGVERDFFYFVHSFAAQEGPWVRARCDYGGPVTAAVAWKNFRGVQFHPERSSKAGARVLRNFLELP